LIVPFAEESAMRALLVPGAVLLGLVLAGATIGAGALREAPTTEKAAKARVALARQIFERIEDELNAPPGDPQAAPEPDRNFRILEQLAIWSRRWMEAEQDLDGDREGRITALKAHLRRIEPREELYRQLLTGDAAGATQLSLDKLTYHRIEAEYELAKLVEGR
jgi:hypothetical protein